MIGFSERLGKKLKGQKKSGKQGRREESSRPYPFAQSARDVSVVHIHNHGHQTNVRSTQRLVDVPLGTIYTALAHGG